jgi:hypothetical protein
MECSVVSNNNLVNQLDILQDTLALFIFFSVSRDRNKINVVDWGGTQPINC